MNSVLIEWSPPGSEFDEVHVQCPSSNITFQSFQLTPIMFIRCSISEGIQFTVRFITMKSGYQSEVFEFIDTLSPSMNE